MKQLKVLFATGAVTLLSAPAFADIGDLVTAATTEMAPVKGGMLDIGVLLLGIAALSFAIAKIISMARGGK